MDWTARNIAFLAEHAGTMTVIEMADHLGCTVHAIYDEASRLRISLRMMPPLVWCDTCAKWRTEVDEDGRCPVCKLREQTEKRREAYQLEYERTRCQQAAETLDETRRYNVAKKQLQRLRERTGGNPRKK